MNPIIKILVKSYASNVATVVIGSGLFIVAISKLNTAKLRPPVDHAVTADLRMEEPSEN